MTKKKATPSNLTEVEKLKRQIKQLRATLKAATASNELQQKEIESLTKKNTNLTRRVAALKPPAAPKPKPKPKPKTQVKPKPVPLAMPKPKVKPKAAPKPSTKQVKQQSDEKKWIDKWWDSF